MTRKLFIHPALFLIIFVFTLFGSIEVQAQADQAVVRAVLFYSPGCPHCHDVIQNVLPPLFDGYPDQLEIIGIDISQPEGQVLYSSAIQHFSIPEDRQGVPTLIVDTVILVGSQEIPDQFPGMIDHYLAQGGVNWPDIPGMSEALDLSTDQESSWLDKLARDPVGNTASIVVLIAMLGAVFWTAIRFLKQPGSPLKESRPWLIPVVCMIGFGVAGYLAYVETAQVEAVCGPVGDCNTVQQSEYARLFGILPIGIMGLIGYIAIVTAWLIGRYAQGRLADLATFSLFLMSLSGTLFSIYLTFLEPFVIGATCAWCLTSSILMTLLMLLTVQPAKYAISMLRGA